MNDNQFMYISSLVCLLLIFYSFRYNKVFAIFNIFIFLAYNSYLYFGFVYRSLQGAGLVWWFFILTLTLIQILVVGIYVGIKFLKKR